MELANQIANECKGDLIPKLSERISTNKDKVEALTIQLGSEKKLRAVYEMETDTKIREVESRFSLVSKMREEF